ncbi:MAG: ipuC [Chthoniobacteraceae bacterium]|nr:ipuC [Chthoniobacteraceae bacterium]
MTLSDLENKIAAGEIDTVVTVFPDVFGRLIGKRITASQFLEHTAKEGTHSCNYLLTLNLEMEPQEGFQLANWESGYGDLEMRPDLETLRVLPWEPGSAMVICDLYGHDGRRVEEAPRSVLRRQIEKLSEQSLGCKLASELEFFLFNQSAHDAFQKDYRGLSPSSDYRIDYHTMQTARDEPIMRAIRNQMPIARIPIESTKGEWGKGQHEVNFIYDEPLPIGDLHCVFKQGARQIVEQHGKCLTFMPKPWAEEVGSSCHIHLSLWRGATNLFGTESGGSLLFKQFLAGLIKYSRDLGYFFAPTINSYKRYQSASWAPTKLAWAHDNRTVGFRVVGSGSSFRIENRLPGADANPYLAFAAMMAAGMAGIEENLECPPIYNGNAYVDASLPSLPGSLKEAAEFLNASRMARKAFGDAAIDFYVQTARLEARAFDSAVTDWERRRYFEQI